MTCTECEQRPAENGDPWCSACRNTLWHLQAKRQRALDTFYRKLLESNRRAIAAAKGKP